MNNLITNKPLTMSSREIAELLGKTHSNLKISAERLSEKGVIGTLAMHEFEHNGNIYTEYLFEKRDCLILVAQNCPEFTAAIVDRWQELEAQQAPKPLTQDEQLIQLAQGVIRLTKERDEAIRTKAQINDKRTATLMNKASQDAKRIKKLEDQLQNQGDYLSIIAANLPQRVDTEIKPNVQTWRILKDISKIMDKDIKKTKDPRYGEVNTYHISVIESFKKLYL